MYTSNGKYLSGSIQKFSLEGSGQVSKPLDMIFIHAYPVDSRMYLRNVQEESAEAKLKKLAEDAGKLKVVLPNLPGFGSSEPFETPPRDLKPYVQAIHEIAEHFKMERFILGGCSMGGYIALEYLREHADSVRSLVLIDTKTRADTPEQRINRKNGVEMLQEAIMTFKEKDHTGVKVKDVYHEDENVREYVDGLHEKISSDFFRRTHAELAAQVKNMMLDQKVMGLIHALGGMAGREDTSELLKEFEKQVILFFGSEDTITPLEVAYELNEMAPHSVLEIVPLAGHLSNFENPEEFNSKMFKWVHDYLPSGPRLVS